MLIYCAQKLLNSFHFTQKKLNFPNKSKSDVTTAVLVQMKANQQHLVFLSRNHVVSDEYGPSPYFGFVEFWVTLGFIVYAVNNRG